MQTLPGSAFTTAGSAAAAPSNLLLFICPGSKVLIEQPGLFQVYRHGVFGAPWGSAEPERPRALSGDAAAAPGADPGQEARDAITVPGLFIAPGPVRWKMLPKTVRQDLLLARARKPTLNGNPARALLLYPLIFAFQSQNCGTPLSRPQGCWEPPPHCGSRLCRVLQGSAPFCSILGGFFFPPALPVPGGCSVPSRCRSRGCCPVPGVGVSGGASTAVPRGG